MALRVWTADGCTGPAARSPDRQEPLAAGPQFRGPAHDASPPQEGVPSANAVLSRQVVPLSAHSCSPGTTNQAPDRSGLSPDPSHQLGCFRLSCVPGAAA